MTLFSKSNVLYSPLTLEWSDHTPIDPTHKKPTFSYEGGVVPCMYVIMSHILHISDECMCYIVLECKCCYSMILII